MKTKTTYKIQVNYDKTLGYVDWLFITKRFESVEETLNHIKTNFKSDGSKTVEVCYDFHRNEGNIKTFYKRLNNTMNLPFRIVE